MKVFSDRLRRRIEAEERYNILEELQLLSEVNHPFVSSPKFFLRRYRAWFKRGGEILFALGIAAIAIVVNYIFFVRLLHFQF